MEIAENPEKRSRIRIKVQLRVYCGLHHVKLLTGYSVDFSPGGLFLATTGTFEMDEIVELRLTVPGEEKNFVTCNARVAWLNQEGSQVKQDYPVGAGLQFLDLAPENLASIVSCLELEPVW